MVGIGASEIVKYSVSFVHDRLVISLLPMHGLVWEKWTKMEINIFTEGELGKCQNLNVSVYIENWVRIEIISRID